MSPSPSAQPDPDDSRQLPAAPDPGEADRAALRLVPTAAAVVAGSRGWLVLGLVFLGLFAFASFVPRGPVWGFHALAYLAAPVRWATLAVSLACLVPPLRGVVAARVRGLLDPLFGDSAAGRVLPFAIGACSSILFYSFPLRTTVYGDSRTILQWFADNSRLTTQWLPLLLDFHPFRSKEVATLLLHRTVAHLFSIRIEEAYRILDALAGASFLALWASFLRQAPWRSRWGAPLLVAGMFLGANQIFFGHVENYAFVFLVVMAFLVTGALALERRASFVTVTLLFLFSVRVHSVNAYLLPAYLFLAAAIAARRFPWVERFLGWRSVSAFLVAPTLAVGALLYFFVFRSTTAPHTDGVTVSLAQTFLPLVPPPPPLDYSILSPAHLLDLANVALLAGTPVVIALGGLLLMHRGAVAWGHPRVIFASLALLYPVIFFVTMNPALSMPRDWDLYGLAAGPLLMFFAMLLAHGDERRIPVAPVLGTVLAFSAFTAGSWALNTDSRRLSHRLEDTGEHVFRTYHNNASLLLLSAYGMEPDSSNALARHAAMAERLEPAAAREDGEYANLSSRLAMTYRARGDRERAVAWMERAADRAPGDLNLALWRADVLLWANRPAEARVRIDGILAQDARNVSALAQGAVAAVTLGDLDGALAYLERARAVDPGAADIAAWIRGVESRRLARGAAARGTTPDDAPPARPARTGRQLRFR